MRKAVRCSLKLEILRAVLACFALSTVVTFASQKASNIVLDYYYSQEAELEHLTGIAEAFGAHVSEQNLSAGDSKAIDEWGTKHAVIIVLPDWENGQKTFRSGTDAKAKWRQAGVTLRLEQPIEYREGDIDTFFIYIPMRPLRNFLLIVKVMLFFCIFILSLSCILKRKLDYLLEIEKGVGILESGELGYAIPERGEDELGRLAESVNAMSRAIRSRILSEQRATQAGREIIGDLSHDIRTPLTVGISYLTMVLENEDLNEQERRHYLTLALKKANQIKDRTGELLDFATIYSGQQPLEKTVVEARMLVDQLKEELAALAPLEVCDELPDGVTVLADSGLLERLFDNVLSNIRKYGDARRPITMHLWAEDGDVRFEIENAVNPKAPADGKSLGLKICSCIAEVHGGRFESFEEGDRYRTFISIPISA